MTVTSYYPVMPITASHANKALVDKEWTILKPRLYIASFPKSGTHMIELAATCFSQPEGHDSNWFGTFQENSWSDQWCNLHIASRIMQAIRPGFMAKGHTGYIPELAKLMYDNAVATVFCYRDFRDIVVSQTHHIMSKDEKRLKHPGRDRYEALGGMEDIMIAVIEGLDEYSGLFARWLKFAGWLSETWVHFARYEDWINDRKGECLRLAEYVFTMAALARGIEEYRYSGESMEQLALAMVSRSRDTGASVTFRRGKVGQWRSTFTPRVTDCFKANDPGWLVALGYEKDDDW